MSSGRRPFGEDMFSSAYILIVASLLLALPALAQTAADTGQIMGVVKDPDQAVVSGSQVTLTNEQTKAKTTAVTDGQGAYVFPSLQPGAYTIEVDAKGFKPGISAELNVVA